MDAIDKNIINNMQAAFPICDRPFAIMAKRLELTEDKLIERIQNLLDDGTLSRFGPLYNLELIGGIYYLVAMSIPENDLEMSVAIINSYPEVAHNYERDHKFNIWFVLATESVAQAKEILHEIEKKTGYMTYVMPKLDEFYVGLKFGV